MQVLLAKGVESLPGVLRSTYQKEQTSDSLGLAKQNAVKAKAMEENKGFAGRAGATIETVTDDSRCESFARFCVVVIALGKKGRSERKGATDAIMKAVCTCAGTRYQARLLAALP